MSFKEIIAKVHKFTQDGHEPATLNAVENLMVDVAPDLRAITVDAENFPYGRYLVWKDPTSLTNIQVDIFSSHYTGKVHSHGTWGMLHVLKGQLTVEDWEERQMEYVHSRSALLSPGSSQAFCPPFSDWHKVRTPESGPQVVSVHIYGQGFDLETGTYLDEQGQAQQSPRGPLLKYSDIEKHFHRTED